MRSFLRSFLLAKREHRTAAAAAHRASRKAGTKEKQEGKRGFPKNQ
jgi:hypothetical protein